MDNETPWLKAKTIELVDHILTSHKSTFGYSLIQSNSLEISNHLASQRLYNLPIPVIAHDNQTDPYITYVNCLGLTLWCRRWEEMVGIPSRLTAPPDEQIERKSALSQALKQESLINYQAIRIDSNGHRFAISNGRIWSIFNQEGIRLGQAATFTNWRRL